MNSVTGAEQFALTVLIAAVVGLAGVMSNRLGEWLPIPTPAFFLIGAAAVSDIWPSLGAVPISRVEQVVTVALAMILFDGGLQIGWGRLRSAAGLIIWLGTAGTVVTGLALAIAAHYLFGMGWHIALLLGTALAPTDPAVVFSVLGHREITGRTGVLLQGESAANDPVGIALLVALIGAHSVTTATVTQAVVAFAAQMLIGLSVGALGGWALLWFMRHVPLPTAGLYLLRVLMCALAIYGIATVLHGSGFLAVLVAGIVLGDARAPYKPEIERFHSALAHLAELVAFVMLGLTIQLTGHKGIGENGVWLVGLILATLLAVVIRPVLVGALLTRVAMSVSERIFVLCTGLKGAVPILLGTFIVGANIPDAHRVYEIIFVVVAFSVIVQGSLAPSLARRLDIPMTAVDPEPWALGVRLQHEPRGLHKVTVGAGSIADGSAIKELPAGKYWVSLIVRDGRLVTVSPTTVLHASDEVLILGAPEAAQAIARIFEG